MGVFFEAIEKVEKQHLKLFEYIENLENNISAIIYTPQFCYLTMKVAKKYPDVPSIGLSPPGRALHFTKYLGTPENPSYIPDTTTPAIDPMSFSERLINTIIYTISEP